VAQFFAFHELHVFVLKALQLLEFQPLHSAAKVLQFLAAFQAVQNLFQEEQVLVLNPPVQFLAFHELHVFELKALQL
jgi:hypothetical protein